ncbi:MAG: AraC family transcriptional regulator [Butyrivibrio sp.]|nr:AraC family transcriptional regulator [Butyrivibrio sp.]
MNIDLIKTLSVITEEEKEILSGKKTINKALYYDATKDTSADNSAEIDSARVLKNGKLIDIRPHTRFVHFPKHTHNYVEFIYMCQGETTHIIDGQKIVLKEGNLLFMNQHAVQEILPASEKDIAVNFMILPQFFDVAFEMMGTDANPLREFIISCLTKQGMQNNYLHFQVAGVLPIQNLMENLIYNMLNNVPNQRTLNQTTMGLLFLNLTNYTELIKVPKNSYDQQLMLKLLRYIESDYKNASLGDFAAKEKIDVYTISRIVKKNTEHSFTDLLQTKRLNQACFMLRTTNIPISDIAEMVGYDNTSFFHRLFKRVYNMSPRAYRIQSE